MIMCLGVPGHKRHNGVMFVLMIMIMIVMSLVGTSALMIMFFRRSHSDTSDITALCLCL